MKSASNTLPEEPLNNVTAGIDWARDDHVVAIVDSRGREIARTMIEHTAAGLRDLISFVRGHGAAEVAIERPDGPVIDTLLGAGLTVVVISPNQVENLRSRLSPEVESVILRAAVDAVLQLDWPAPTGA